MLIKIYKLFINQDGVFKDFSYQRKINNQFLVINIKFYLNAEKEIVYKVLLNYYISMQREKKINL